MRLKLFLVGLALGIALWVTMSVQSFLYAFLIAFALLVLAVGTGTVLSDLDRPSATYTEADLERHHVRRVSRCPRPHHRWGCGMRLTVGEIHAWATDAVTDEAPVELPPEVVLDLVEVYVKATGANVETEVGE